MASNFTYKNSHIQNSPLICFASQWTGFYMIGNSVIKELINCMGRTCQRLIRDLQTSMVVILTKIFSNINSKALTILKIG